jgi:hypothetical protein
MQAIHTTDVIVENMSLEFENEKGKEKERACACPTFVCRLQLMMFFLLLAEDDEHHDYTVDGD